MRCVQVPSRILLWTVCVAAWGITAVADDWPTYRHDVSRTGTTSESLDASLLAEAWVHTSPARPLPAWPGPARWDAWAMVKDLPSMRNYDPCFHVVAADGAVYFGSSTDDSVYKLDGKSGEVMWTFTTGGPIRIAPMLDKGRVYFGSDDGAAYCVDAKSGELHWRYEVKPDERMVLNNGRAVSFHPIRTGVVVRDDVAYFGASLLPWKKSYLVAVDAMTGTVGPPGTFVQEFDRRTMEGAMLATDRELILPQGRVAPERYERSSGEAIGSLSGGGGVFVVITDTQHILRHQGGHGDRSGRLTGDDRLAQYDRGHALVVSGDYGFLLDLESVIAVDLSNGQERWRYRLDAPSDLVLAGSTLYVGSRSKISAFDAHAGTHQWSATLPGTAHGIAVADGALIVSTDAGTIHSFREGAQPNVPASEELADTSTAEPSPAVRPVQAHGLLNRWVFHRSAMRDANGQSVESDSFRDVYVRNQAGELHGRLRGQAGTERFGEIEAMHFRGKGYVELGTDSNDPVMSAAMPKQAFSVETWVRVDEQHDWGGIVSCIRDNGEDEQGWMLGFRNDRFCFALRSEQTKSLTYLDANLPFQTGDWAHVAATYDGSVMRLYVNGRFEASSDAQNGAIVYPDSINYVLGAYKDEDEEYQLHGMMYEARVYDLALGDRDIAALYEAQAIQFPEPRETTADEDRLLTFGPYVRFTAPGTVQVQWTAAQPGESEVVFFQDDEQQVVASEANGTEHVVFVSNLRPDTVYQYQVRVTDGDEERTSRSFECDTHFNYSLRPVLDRTHDLSRKDSQSRALAEQFAPQLSDHVGMIVVGDVEDASLAHAIAASTNLSVICLLDDPAQVAAERSRLVSAEVYGRRLSILPSKSLDRLPALFANVVMLGPAKRADKKSEIRKAYARLLQPGGKYFHGADLAWTAPPISGSGDWGHMYGKVDNSSYGGESLAGASATDDLEVQWVGRPGPRYQSDRQNRKSAPLASGGRLYMQGLQRIICSDQYNGVIRWSIELPEMMRWNIPRDTANWCADDTYLYVAVQDKVVKIDGQTGAIQKEFRAQGNTTDARHWDWGYVARVDPHDSGPGGVLLGSSVRAEESYTQWWGKSYWYDQTGGEMAAKVASDTLFAMDPVTGSLLWERRGGLVFNSTISVGEPTPGQPVLYFVENRSKELRESSNRRLYGDTTWQQMVLVGLDARTGQVVLEKKIETANADAAFYLLYTEGKLLLSTSADNQFGIWCLDANDGAANWDTQFEWQSDNHGKHMARPAVASGLVYLRPKVLDLETGSQLDLVFPDGHQCGSYTLTDNALFARAGDTMMWSVRDKSISRWDRHRPDCWISTIPAGGMLLSPEAGGGCSCGSWIETSLGWMPRLSSDQAGMMIDADVPSDEHESPSS